MDEMMLHLSPGNHRIFVTDGTADADPGKGTVPRCCTSALFAGITRLSSVIPSL
ncbi:MAG: hypothetical protein IKN55_10935 [Oscillospiraceae bacterium]|nr:hypothetical protein [Oscillospiraceae bacterium]